MKKKPIKILHISSYPPPRAGWGVRIYFLKKEMEKQRHICDVLNIGKGRFLKGKDFVPVLGGADYIKKVFKYRLNGYLIHMHLNGDSPKGFILTTLAMIISVLTFCRPVITFHAGPVQKYFPQSQAPYLNLFYKCIFKVPKIIICNNRNVKMNIAGYGIAPEKIVPIQAFSKQYLNFNYVQLDKETEKFFNNHHRVICSYVFFRPEFFIEKMIYAIASMVKKYERVGLIIMGSDAGSEDIRELIYKLGLGEHILLAGDQNHDSFLTILSRSIGYLRTPVKDGVCSSVLEALSLGVPVVASENGSRPESVITYQNEDVDDMVSKLSYLMEDYTKVKTSIVKPEIRDTVNDEIRLISKL